MPRTPDSNRSNVDRYTWPVAIVVLVFAVATVTVAMIQSVQLRDAYEDRDRSLATATGGYVGEYLSSGLAEQVDWFSRNPESISAPPNELAEHIQLDYLAEGVNTPVVAVAVVDRDGQIAVWRLRGSSIVGTGGELLSEVSQELLATSEEVADSGLAAFRGVATGDEQRYYLQAQPLTSGRYAAWVSVVDVAETPLAAFFSSDRGANSTSLALLDESADQLLGTQVNNGLVVDVPGTSWQVAAGRISSPRTVPTWAFGLLLAAILTLGAAYLVQDRARRRLREEAERAAARAAGLYLLANELLQAPDPEEQARILADHTRQMLGIPAVEVRIARRGVGVVWVGEMPRNRRTYRIAIMGPAGPVGELRAYTRAESLPEQARSDARTVTTVAGAALHARLLVERERDTARELQRLDELRTNLLSTVAHELRSPLAAVKGILGLMSMSDGLRDKEREYVDIATERTDALVALIRDLFARSLLDAGTLELDRGWHSAATVLERAVEPVMAQHPGQVTWAATEGLELNIDPMRFDQIITNLLSNAAKYGDPPVSVELRRSGRGARLTVTDAGPGIPVEERERIFDRFYQAAGGTDRAADGAGLGLALVHGLVELHGGTISVQAVNDDGTGARFVVVLPDARVAAAAEAARHDPDAA